MLFRVIFFEIISGLKDFDPNDITEELGPIAKLFTIAGLLSGFGSGKAAREGGAKILDEIKDDYSIKDDELEEIVLEVASDYEVNSIDDLVRLKDELNLAKIKSKVIAKIIVKKHGELTKEGQIQIGAKYLGIISTIGFKDGELIIYAVDKGEKSGFYLSDIILEQLRSIGVNLNSISSIQLSEVVNKDIYKSIFEKGFAHTQKNWGNIGSLDKMSNHIISSLSKSIDHIELIELSHSNVSNIYSIKLTLK